MITRLLWIGKRGKRNLKKRKSTGIGGVTVEAGTRSTGVDHLRRRDMRGPGISIAEDSAERVQAVRDLRLLKTRRCLSTRGGARVLRVIRAVWCLLVVQAIDFLCV